jgi:hypothetical protein
MRYARQGDADKPRCERCRAIMRARGGCKERGITYYYCPSTGCRLLKLPGVKRPRPIWTAFGLTLEQEKALLLSRVAVIDKLLNGAKRENTRGSGGGCAC